MDRGLEKLREELEERKGIEFSQAFILLNPRTHLGKSFPICIKL